MTDESEIQEFFSRLDAAVWIFQNAKYDITQLRRFAQIPERRKLWDTMLIEQIMYSGYYTDFSLQDLVRRYLGVHLVKDTRETFSEATELTREQIEYACIDVAATWRVYQAQRQIIDETDLNLWKHIELPFFWTLLDMQGLPINVQAWTALYEKNLQEALDIQKKYMDNPEVFDQYDLETIRKKKLLKGLNLSSPKQVAVRLKELGIKASTTGEDDIKSFREDYEFVQDLLDYRGKIKAAGTYGKSWIEDGLIEADGKVYSDFYQIGAGTGRLSSSNPNVENIPSKDTHEFRECFIAPEGYVLVDADWSAQEPRIFAYLSQDEKLLQIFQEKKDVYIEAARLMFDWELTKKDPRRKERMKPTVLGACYGLTEYGMEKKYEVPREEGRELLKAFFDTFEGAAIYKDKQQRIRDFVRTIYGRKFWLNTYQRGFENNSLNSPVQGSAADAMKIAGAKMCRAIRESDLVGRVAIVNYVHDEILLVCTSALLEWTTVTLREIMIQVAEEMHPGIPAEIEINSGENWYKAHN